MLKKVKKILPILCACVLVFGSCLTVSAAESTEIVENTVFVLPTDLPTVDGYDYKIVVKGTSKYFLSMSKKPFVYVPSVDEVRSTDSFRAYELTNDEWVCTATNAASGNRVVSSDFFSNIVYSSHDIYNNTGELFFQKPVELLTLKAVSLVPMVRKQMKMIVPVAVSCLALLVGLVVLRKKLPIFLS